MRPAAFMAAAARRRRRREGKRAVIIDHAQEGCAPVFITFSHVSRVAATAGYRRIGQLARADDDADGGPVRSSG
jgi:hypothetical protein